MPCDLENCYIDNNGLCEVFQSAYRAYNSTETALLRVYNDIAKSIDNQKSVVLFLLDLSADFDTVYHSLLLDQALDWFRSYLSDRTQYVRIQDVSSDVHALPYGVPQGSVLGPLLYSLYTSPLGDIARSHGLSYHFYTDDTQLYLSFETSSPEDLVTEEEVADEIERSGRLRADATNVRCHRRTTDRATCFTTRFTIGTSIHKFKPTLPADK